MTLHWFRQQIAEVHARALLWWQGHGGPPAPSRPETSEMVEVSHRDSRAAIRRASLGWLAAWVVLLFVRAWAAPGPDVPRSPSGIVQGNHGAANRDAAAEAAPSSALANEMALGNHHRRSTVAESRTGVRALRDGDFAVRALRDGDFAVRALRDGDFAVRALRDGDFAVRALRDGRPLPVNRADVVALRLLPGVGPKLAERIVDDRTQRGAFRDLVDLQRVQGIGEKTALRLAPLLSFVQDGDQHRQQGHSPRAPGRPP